MAIHRITSTKMKDLTPSVRDFMRYGCWIYGRYAYSSPYIITNDNKYAVDLYFHDDELINKHDNSTDFIV